MATFPPPSWEFRPLEDMDRMEATPRDSSGFSMQALLAVAPARGLEGNYAYLIASRGQQELRVPVLSIIADKRFENMYIEAQMELGTQVMLAKNSSCSDWLDIYELAQSQDVEVTNCQGQPITEAFIQAIQAYQNEQPIRRAGICWRWALAVRRGMVYLDVLALPCSKDAIEDSQELTSDAATGILISTSALAYDRLVTPPLPL